MTAKSSTDGTGFVPLCTLSELADNSSAAFEVGEQSVLLCRSGGDIYAIANRCTHQDTPLAQGRVRGGYVICPLHGVRFSLLTGEPTGQLTRVPVDTFAVRIEEDTVSVNVSLPRAT